jgi:hypothetical protein
MGFEDGTNGSTIANTLQRQENTVSEETDSGKKYKIC